MTWAGRPGSGRCRSGKTAAPVRRRLGGAGVRAGHDAAAARLFNSDELRDAIERLPPEQYLAASYYERWLGAIEMLVTEKGRDGTAP